MEAPIDTFSNRLNLALQIRNMKAQELAEKTGISKSKISSYRAGRFKAKQDSLSRLSKALYVSPVWLMGYNVPMEEENLKALEKRTQETTTICVYGVIPARNPY